MFRVEFRTFWPPIAICKLLRDKGLIVEGHVSNGDFHWESPNPLLATAPMNGQISTAVGCTIPLLTKALKEDPEVILV